MIVLRARVKSTTLGNIPSAFAAYRTDEVRDDGTQWLYFRVPSGKGSTRETLDSLLRYLRDNGPALLSLGNVAECLSFDVGVLFFSNMATCNVLLNQEIITKAASIGAEINVSVYLTSEEA